MIENKILNAVKNNKLNPNIFGERKWYNYFIQVNELVWSRNIRDDYQIHVYSDSFKKEHLTTVTI